MTERIQVKETVVYSGDFAGKLEHIIAMLQDWKNEGEWEGIQVEYDYYDCPRYSLYKHRPETDEEYETRMKELEKKKAAELKSKERRRKEYEKLKKEFEGN